MSEPFRFRAFNEAGDLVSESQDPSEVQRGAETYASEHRGEHVHLYQHVISIKAGDDE